MNCNVLKFGLLRLQQIISAQSVFAVKAEWF